MEYVHTIVSSTDGWWECARQHRVLGSSSAAHLEQWRHQTDRSLVSNYRWKPVTSENYLPGLNEYLPDTRYLLSTRYVDVRRGGMWSKWREEEWSVMKLFPILLLATQICCSSAWRFFDMNIIRHEPSNHFICFFFIHLELDVRESRRKCNRRSSSYS